jgi:hypothetical protein
VVNEIRSPRVSAPSIVRSPLGRLLRRLPGRLRRFRLLDGLGEAGADEPFGFVGLEVDRVADRRPFVGEIRGDLVREVSTNVLFPDRLALDSANTCSPSVKVVTDLPIPELVENRRRSIAMLPSGAPALTRDEALELLDQLEAALVELRKLRAQREVR